MGRATCFQRTYDHRLKELVRETGDFELAVRHGDPRSTARGWLRSRKDVVTLDVLETPGKELHKRSSRSVDGTRSCVRFSGFSS
jgi:hypothetical protein